VLIAVAIFLSKEVKNLLLGESADPIISEKVKHIIGTHHEIQEVISCITIQQGPGEVLKCVKIKCIKNITAVELSKLINNFEKEIRQDMPEVKWLYIEPDLQECKA
jgi:divalent metal cation (Fe/Co/Zn/Cd) transporter